MRRALAIGAALLSLAACDQQVAGPSGLTSFKVELTSELGSPDARLPLRRATQTLRLKAAALDADGETMTAYSSVVDPKSKCCVENCPSLRVTPGSLLTPSIRLVFESGVATHSLITIPSGGTSSCIKRSNAADGAIPVDVARVYSATRLWVEDLPSGGAAGMGGPVWFDDPAIQDLQWIEGMAENFESPLAGGFVTSSQGDMIVTAIFSDGFYVTDLEARRSTPMPDPLDPGRSLPGRFESIFMFNFNYPDNLLFGDRVKSISGTATDFSGATQLTFPAWVRDSAGPYLDDLPLPRRIGAAECNWALDRPDDPAAIMCGYSAQNWALESLESSIVCATLKVSQDYDDCDSDGDGNIMNPSLSGGGWTCVPFGSGGPPNGECQCLLNCHGSRGPHAGRVCTEASSQRQFQQWIGAFDDGAGPRILVQSASGAPLFDPTAPANRGRTVAIAGPLRQIRAARPRWLIQVRDEESICLDPPCPGFRCE